MAVHLLQLIAKTLQGLQSIRHELATSSLLKCSLPQLSMSSCSLFTGVLAKKARMLVTNQLQYLPKADKIIYSGWWAKAALRRSASAQALPACSTISTPRQSSNSFTPTRSHVQLGRCASIEDLALSSQQVTFKSILLPLQIARGQLSDISSGLRSPYTCADTFKLKVMTCNLLTA